MFDRLSHQKRCDDTLIEILNDKKELKHYENCESVFFHSWYKFPSYGTMPKVTGNEHRSYAQLYFT